MIFPICVVQFSGGIEGGDGAAFVATARLVMAMAGTHRFAGGGDLDDRLE
jgi:hypothetical protein